VAMAASCRVQITTNKKTTKCEQIIFSTQQETPIETRSVVP
jgi:hypothetical protein